MKRFVYLGIFLMGILLVNTSYAYRFSYNVKKDTTYQLFSASIQNLQQNVGQIKSATWEQAYEALLKVNDVKPEGALLSGQYRYSQRPFIKGEAYERSDQRVYYSTFTRSPLGVLNVLSEMDYYPTVRSVPVFPDRDLKTGEEWDNDGYEVQDFGAIGYKRPLNVPFNAHYKYLGDLTLNSIEVETLLARYKLYKFQVDSERGALLLPKSKTDEIPTPTGKETQTQITQHFALINVLYKVNYDEKLQPIQTETVRKDGAVPVKNAQGYYKGIIFWDKDKSEEFFSIGEYDFNYNWDNGESRRWTGKEYGSVNVMTPNVEKIKALEDDAKKTLDKTVEVNSVKEGVKIIFGDLLFEFNKTSIKHNIQSSLDKVVALLKKNSHSIIRISGYSDDIGSLEAKNRIAQGRARSVANYLVTHGIDMSRVTYKGFGDSNPRVSNTNAENRKKNRRVELDIIAG